MTYEDWLISTATISTCDWEDPPSRTSGSLFVGYFTVGISYSVEGKRYSGKFHSSRAWKKDTEVGILYDPQNPMESLVCDEDDSQLAAVLWCVLEMLG